MRYATNYNKVVEFTTKAEQPLGVGFNMKILEQKMDLISEEYAELEDVILELPKTRQTKENLIKEACDLLYVVYGLFAAIGVDADEAFQVVHASNMSKLTDGKLLKNDQGKILKGPNYSPANMEHLVP